MSLLGGGWLGSVLERLEISFSNDWALITLYNLIRRDKQDTSESDATRISRFDHSRIDTKSYVEIIVYDHLSICDLDE